MPSKGPPTTTLAGLPKLPTLGTLGCQEVSNHCDGRLKLTYQKSRHKDGAVHQTSTGRHDSTIRCQDFQYGGGYLGDRVGVRGSKRSDILTFRYLLNLSSLLHMCLLNGRYIRCNILSDVRFPACVVVHVCSVAALAIKEFLHFGVSGYGGGLDLQ
jgi:hypothetical protein